MQRAGDIISKASQGLASGNPALYCVEDSTDVDQNVDVNGGGDNAGSERGAADNGVDTSSFDIVKATQFGVLDRVRSLVEERGFDVNERDGENVTLLHWAAINNRLEICEFLIGRGAVVDAVGGELQTTPLAWATRQGHLRMVVLLMRHGGDPRAMDAQGLTCIHVAAQFGFSAILAYLVAKGCNVNAPDQKGMTPLMWLVARETFNNNALK
jgi:palmitoyltransferase